MNQEKTKFELLNEIYTTQLELIEVLEQLNKL